MSEHKGTETLGVNALQRILAPVQGRQGNSGRRPPSLREDDIYAR